MQLDERLHECAKTLNNGKLVAKLSGADVVAQVFKYHPGCLAKLYNDEKAALKKQLHHLPSMGQVCLFASTPTILTKGNKENQCSKGQQEKDCARTFGCIN